MVTVNELKNRVERTFDHVVADLESLVRIPSVSNANFDQSTLRASANEVVRLLAGVGVDASVASAPGPDGAPGRPAVLASSAGEEGLPVVLLYAHHDVQPEGPRELWDQEDPYVPVIRGERMFGRGTGDDKAGIAAHIGALRALGDDLRVGVRCFFEGEEEVGSPSFANFLREHHETLAADVIVVLDSANWAVGIPAITTSLRGLVEAEVELRILDHALHSGMYGGPVLDPVILMARLLATLHDERGDVAVAGLHHREAAPVDYPEDSFRADAGLLDGVQLAGTGSIPSRLWTKPAIGVVGIDATSVARRSNTIPTSCRAALSLRVPPGQDPAEAFEALRQHLEAHVPFGAHISVTVGELGPGFLAPSTSAAMELGRWALSAAWGGQSVETGLGGSIPFIAELCDAFPHAEVLLTGVEDPDTRAHSENESVHLGELQRAVLAEALLLARLSGTLEEE